MIKSPEKSGQTPPVSSPQSPVGAGLPAKARPANIIAESPAIIASNPLPRASYLTNQHHASTVTAALYVTYTLTWSFGFGSIYPNRARSSGAGLVRHYVRAFLFLGLEIFLPQLLRSPSIHT
jgi:hypothetical protein